MEFGPINLAGGILVALILIPNIIYALRNPGIENKCTNLFMNLLEQVGRYGCMALMVLPVGVWKFGFPSVGDLLLWLFGNGMLLLLYWGCWFFYLRLPGKKLAIALAVIPACIFILSGQTLRHWLLVIAGILFGIAHLYVTLENNK